MDVSREPIKYDSQTQLSCDGEGSRLMDGRYTRTAECGTSFQIIDSCSRK